jgi:HEAT repeat protein
MENSEEISELKNIIQIVLKTWKISRLYPQNNPVYVKTMRELSDRLDKFLGVTDSLPLFFGKNNIYYKSESVYHNPERQDNLALIFFKDGLRELTFKKGLSIGELSDFIKIISQDFDKDEVEDDLVTLLWGKNFENIQYVVEDHFLTEGEELEEKAVREAKQKTSSCKEDLQKIYEDNTSDSETIKDLLIFSLTDEDFRLFFDELKKDAPDKTRKLFNILFEIFLGIDKKEEYHDFVNHFMRTIEFSVRRGSLDIVAGVQSSIEQILGSNNIHEEAKGHLSKIILFAGGHSVMELIGEILDNGSEIDEQAFKDFVSHLKANAIHPLVKLLGDLKNISSRRLIIDALVHIGRKDVSLLLEEMNDSRWYVVRNIVHVLRKIGDKKAIKNLLKLLSHKDIRVKKEAVRALGELGGDEAVADLRAYLNDPHIQIRKAVLSALGNICSDSAKKVIMDHIAGKGFKDKELDEKKECFQTLAVWHDDDVYDFLVRMVKKRSFFSQKRAENRACAAYCLGLLDKKEALPVLNKYKTNGNKLLREFSVNAIRKLEYGS